MTSGVRSRAGSRCGERLKTGWAQPEAGVGAENRAIEAAQVIEEPIELQREMREAEARGEWMGLPEEDPAFYDALETNDSAVQVLGDETLRAIARALVDTVRRNVTIDWTLRESVRAHLRALMRRILRRHGCPPDNRRRRRSRSWSRRRCCRPAGLRARPD